MNLNLLAIEIILTRKPSRFCFWFQTGKNGPFSSLYTDTFDYSRFMRRQKPKIIAREYEYDVPFSKPKRVTIKFAE